MSDQLFKTDKSGRQRQTLGRHNAIKLLRIIGCPGITKHKAVEAKESDELYELAFQNRIALLYLNALSKQDNLNRLSDLHTALVRRYKKTVSNVARVASILSEKKIPYVLIKTIRSYPSTPNDIDLLYLGEDSELGQVVRSLAGLGYRKSNVQLGEIGFWDPQRPTDAPRSGNEIDYIDVDLYREIMVKNFTYFDKQKLIPYVVEQTLFPGQSVCVLTPPVDLAFVILHSVFPNRSYGLEIFYTTMHYLHNANQDDLALLVKFANENYLIGALRAGIEITMGLCQDAFGYVPDKLRLVHGGLQKKRFYRAANVIIPHSFPYIYSLRTFLGVGFVRLGHRKSFLSFLSILVCFLNPFYAREVLQEVFSRKEARQRYQLNY